jgi:hypothetical protein
MTRTSGRMNVKNCVSLSDIIHKDQLESACIVSSLIVEEDLYRFLPLSHNSNEIPVSAMQLIGVDVELTLMCRYISVET